VCRSQDKQFILQKCPPLPSRARHPGGDQQDFRGRKPGRGGGAVKGKSKPQLKFLVFPGFLFPEVSTQISNLTNTPCIVYSFSQYFTYDVPRGPPDQVRAPQTAAHQAHRRPGFFLSSVLLLFIRQILPPCNLPISLDDWRPPCPTSCWFWPPPTRTPPPTPRIENGPGAVLHDPFPDPPELLPLLRPSPTCAGGT